jgi:hypothetical protein
MTYYTTPLRRLVFKFKFSSNFKTNTESLVETQCLRLRDAQSYHKTKNLTLIRKVKSKQGGNYLFVFLKKKLSNMGNLRTVFIFFGRIKQAPQYFAFF